MPVFLTLAAGGATIGFGPNCSWSKIDQFESSAVFATNHTLVAGDWIKVALWYVQLAVNTSGEVFASRYNILTVDCTSNISHNLGFVNN